MEAVALLFTIFSLSCVFAIFCALVASSKNRSGFLWFLLGGMFGIVALFAVGFMPARPE